MNYSQIDSTISKWVDKHNLSLFTSVKGNGNTSYRTVYISSTKGECCQIWIDEPISGKVCIHVADVESEQDEKLAKEWCVPLEELGEALDNTISFIYQWFGRKNA
ncbi:hypothetical protein [Spartinivicinus ruber]|uniref:hypothetical protein n=1 Tax=Spartinivicinus ruber TaxID=2683272 RepID=UPI0013CFC0EC|nr:hypothetical protein [Spartinivicinus ruber]